MMFGLGVAAGAAMFGGWHWGWNGSGWGNSYTSVNVNKAVNISANNFDANKYRNGAMAVRSGASRRRALPHAGRARALRPDPAGRPAAPAVPRPARGPRRYRQPRAGEPRRPARSVRRSGRAAAPSREPRRRRPQQRVRRRRPRRPGGQSRLRSRTLVVGRQKLQSRAAADFMEAGDERRFVAARLAGPAPPSSG